MKKILLTLMLWLLGIDGAQSQTPFYQGKTITNVVGYQPGDG